MMQTLLFASQFAAGMKCKLFEEFIVRLILPLYWCETPVIRRLLADRLSVVEMI